MDPQSPKENPASTPDYREKLLEARKKYSESIPSLLAQGGVPELFWNANLEAVPENMAEVLKPGGSFFINGVVGSGKSYMMAATVRAYLMTAKMFKFTEGDYYRFEPERKEFLFMAEYNLFNQIRSCYSRNKCEMDFIDRICRVPLLAIDDFGTEPNKEWISSKMFSIIDRRYCSNRKTLITSNVSLEYISQSIDDRIASRISEMCTIIELGESIHDRRVKKMKRFTF